MLTMTEYWAIRDSIAAISHDVSSDAIGSQAPRLDEIFAPQTHAAALDPATPIVIGARGAGKSFWSGVLGNEDTRKAAAKAYPRLGLLETSVGFGFTGLDGPGGIGTEALDAYVGPEATIKEAKAFWWATLLKAALDSTGGSPEPLRSLINMDWERRQDLLTSCDAQLRADSRSLLVVYDALDMVGTTWPRRRLLTSALLEVAWAVRAYRAVNVKLFLRPDQLEDDELRFVELPKLRTGAVRLIWTPADLYGLLFARLAQTPHAEGSQAFKQLLEHLHLSYATQDDILSRRWTLSYDLEHQAKVMDALAGRYMGEGRNGYKKGKTFDWIYAHLGDAFGEVTPRSFLGLLIAAAKHGSAPVDKSLSPDGIRHGLRAASKTRVDQLHLEFPWIKGVLTPLAGLLLPQQEHRVYETWQEANTLPRVIEDAQTNNYLPPFPAKGEVGEGDLFVALERIGVMFRRKDGRLDMPDLFRVAAKLLKKGGTAPV